MSSQQSCCHLLRDPVQAGSKPLRHPSSSSSLLLVCNRAWAAPGCFCFLFRTLLGPFLIVELAGLRLGLTRAPVLCRFLVSHLSDLHSMSSPWRFRSWWEAWQAQQWGQDPALPYGQGTKLLVRSAFCLEMFEWLKGWLPLCDTHLPFL